MIKRYRLLMLLLALGIGMSVVGKTMSANRQPCNDEWNRLVESPADNGDKLKQWISLRSSCANSGIYESRLATLYALAGRFTEARDTIKVGLTLKTEYEKELLSTLASIDMAENRLGSAFDQYETLIHRYPEYFDGHAGAGAVKLLMQQYQQAIDYLNSALKHGRSTDVYRNLTLAYHQLGRCEDAVKSINDGYAFDKLIVKDKDAMHAAARCYVSLGKYRAADGTLKLLLQANPEVEKDPEIAKTFSFIAKKLRESQ